MLPQAPSFVFPLQIAQDPLCGLRSGWPVFLLRLVQFFYKTCRRAAVPAGGPASFFIKTCRQFFRTCCCTSSGLPSLLRTNPASSNLVPSSKLQRVDDDDEVTGFLSGHE